MKMQGWGRTIFTRKMMGLKKIMAAVFLMTGMVQAMPVITARGAGALDTDLFPAAFTPVSAADLANADQATFQSTSGVDTGGRPDTVDRLFDGIAGVGTGYEAQFNSGSVTVNFDLSVHTNGYDISGINTYAAWNTLNGGRSDQEYTLTVICMDDSEAEITSGTHYANTTTATDENGEINVWTEVHITDDTGIIASGVKSIRFDFLTGANAGGTATYTEFDVWGVPSTPRTFVHPGLSHKLSDLQRMRAMTEAGIEPYATSYALLAAHARSSYTMEVAGGNTGMTELDSSWNNYLKNDGITAYYNALMWMMTGDSRHADKAIEVFTVWSDLKRNTQTVPLSTGRHWKLIEAAEIIKSTYDGWAEEDIQKFKDMLVYPGYSNTTIPTEAIANNDITFYWRIYQGDPARHGNQGIFAMRVMMAMGVFLDNEMMYDRAVRYLRGQSHRADDLPYISGPSITTGPTAVYDYYEEYSRSGQEDTIPDYGYNEVISNYVYETGQCQESSRDQAHSLGGVGTLCTMAEIAWNQGDDLYGHLDNRLLLGLSFWYRYNLSWDYSYPDQLEPWEPTVESGEYVERFDRSGRWKALKINPYLTYNIGEEYWHRGRTNLLVSPILEATLGHYKYRMDLPEEDTKWLERGFEFLTNEVGVEQLTTTDHAGLGGLKYRRVSPGDPISGFSVGHPVYAMNTLPGTIEAELFDYFTLNGEGHTYHDLTATNSGGAYRISDGVDIAGCSEGGYALTDLDAGEWLTYTVAVPDSSAYEISIRYAAAAAGAKIRFSFDETDKTGEVILPYGGSFSAGADDWRDYIVATDVPLDEGVQSMKINISGASGAVELNTIAITRTETVAAFGYEVSSSTSDTTAPTVSSSDLAQIQYLSSSATGGNDSSEHAQLFNGTIGNTDTDTNDSGEVRLTSDNTVSVTFDTSVHTNGYDLTGIQTCFGWGTDGGGRSNQGYEIRLTTVDGSVETLAGPAHWEPNSPAGYWTTVSFTTGSNSVMASGVKAVTFDITQDANASGVVIAREFDVFGVPTELSEAHTPAFLPGVAVSNGTLYTEFSGTVGEHYRLEFKGSLSSVAPWQVQTNIEALSASPLELSVPATNGTRFYRLRWLP
jgi:hypothetical protein